MEATKSEKSPRNRSAVEAILTPDNLIQPAPAERIGPSHNEGNMSPPPKPNRGHTRPLSFAGRNGNRLSLSFPIQLPDRERSLNRQTPTSSTSMTSQHSPTKEAVLMPSPKDSAGFMVALAAQERRVLELREELNRAENELKRLKRQWAVHEGSKKRAEIKHVEQLRPVHMTALETNSGSDDLEEVAAIRRSSELDRRRALHANLTKDSRRKIITGGHTRALSLLSPDRGPYDGFPSSSSALNSDSDSVHTNTGVPPSPVIPDTSQGLTRRDPNRVRHSYHDSATSGVKQIAEDIKVGLWTFMEDLRQATVGDEAVQNSSVQPASDLAPTKLLGKKSSKGSLDGSNRSHLRAVSTSKARTGQLQDGSSPKHTLAKTQIQTVKPTLATTVSPDLDDDDWANWDSPISKGTSPRWSNSTTISSQDTGTGTSNAASPSTYAKTEQSALAAEGTPKREDIPWPALKSLTPGNLKRTASAIMKEWEKSLTPSPENRSDPMSAISTGKKLASDQETRLLLSNLP